MTTTDTPTGNLITIALTLAQINAGGFLMGRYNVETDYLSGLTVVKDRGALPPTTDHFRYALIGFDDQKMPGLPLRDYIAANWEDWDGNSNVVLHFNKISGEFVRATKSMSAHAA